MDLIHEAIKLKQAQIGSSRERFLRFPAYRQRTLYSNNRLRANQPPATQGWTPSTPASTTALMLEQSYRDRATGVDHFGCGRFTAAGASFEAALLPFFWLSSHKSDVGDFVDDDLTWISPTEEEVVLWVQDSAFPSSLGTASTIWSHFVSVHVNLGVVFFKERDYHQSQASTQQALILSRFLSAKAAYWQAMCLSKAPSSGGMELDQAVDILKNVVTAVESVQTTPIEIPVSDGDVRNCVTLLAELQVEQRKLNHAASRTMRHALAEAPATDSLPPAEALSAPPKVANPGIANWKQLWLAISQRRPGDDEVAHDRAYQAVVDKCGALLWPALHARGCTGFVREMWYDPEVARLMADVGLESMHSDAAQAVCKRLQELASQNQLSSKAARRAEDAIAERLALQFHPVLAD